MIYTERKVFIKNGEATIDSPIILFRGDREVDIMFTIVDSKFKFESNKGNVIDKTQASFGQLAVALPNGTDLFTEMVRCENGVVVFSITGEMIDEIDEVGFYSFHIRLYNDDKTSRITIPAIMNGIEIKEPIVIEDDDNGVIAMADVGEVDEAIIEDEQATFLDENGNLNIEWKKGDIISSLRLNQMVSYINDNAEVDLSAYALKEDLPIFIINEKQKDYLLEGTKYHKTLISLKGSIIENANYDAVVIPNFNAGTYTISGKIRQIYAFTGEIGGTCTLLETVYNSSDTVYKNTFTVTQPCTLVVNFFVNQMDISVLVDGDEIINRGDEVLIPNLSLNDKLRNDIESIIIDEPLTITVTENKYISIQCSFGSGKITQNAKLDELSNNGCFNLVDTVVTDVIGEGDRVVHVVKDAITPVRTYQTLGANHGHPGFSLTVNDKSQIDVGSVWTDGVNDYVMVAYTNNKVTFAYPYTFNSQITGASKVNPIATLTHKSGATHTSDIAIDTFKDVASIYKSINKHSVEFFIDDNEISLEDGTYLGSTFIVKEEYNIVDYKAMQEYLKANVGSMCNDDNIEGTLRVSLIYKFTESGACIIYYSIKALSNKVRLQNCGFVQSELLSVLNGYTTNRILPGVKEKSGINFGKLVDMSKYNTSLVFYKDDLIDPEQPCNRSIDIITDSKGDYVMGHAIGYICDKFDGSDKHRLSNDTLLWDMRNTKKSYPVGISNVILQPGEYLSFACFRNYISPYDLQDKVIVNKIVEDDCTYIIIDSTDAISGSYEIKELLGKKISIVNSRNFTLDYDYVDSNGINYSIGENGGSAVLKVSNKDFVRNEIENKIAELENRIVMLEEFITNYKTSE